MALTTDGQTLYNERKAAIDRMYNAINQMGSHGCVYADQQKKYRIALARAVAAERDKGTPAAVALTMAKGTEKVAEIERLMEEARAKSEMFGEYGRAYKTEANFLNEEIQRQWGVTK